MSAGSGGGGLFQGSMLAGIIVAVIVISALLGTLLACIFCRIYHRRRAQLAGGKGLDKGNPMLPMFWTGSCFNAGKGGASGSKAPQPSTDGPGGLSTSSATACSDTSEGSPGCSAPEPLQHQVSDTSAASSISRSRSRSAFSADIAQVGHQGVTELSCT